MRGVIILRSLRLELFYALVEMELVGILSGGIEMSFTCWSDSGFDLLG